jgi:hypothetical protein
VLTMGRAKPLWWVFVALSVATAAAVSYGYAVYTGRAAGSHALAHTQAVLAVGHFRSYEQIESLIERKCFEAALMEARELKNLQVTLASENLRATHNDPELIEYMRTRAPKLHETISSGRLPALKTHTTACP